MGSDTWHVYPVDDLIEHETTGGECVCIPDAKLHDGRELKEAERG